jgi:hypothetical protein
VKLVRQLNANSNSIINVTDPSSAQDAATKSYVDGKVATAVVTWSYSGTLAVTTGTFRWYNDTGRTLTITKIRASVGTAPTGASVICDVNKNGTTVFTTQSNRPTIAVSTNTALGTPNVTSLADGDYLTVDIDQIGSSTPGSNLTVTITVS